MAVRAASAAACLRPLAGACVEPRRLFWLHASASSSPPITGKTRALFYAPQVKLWVGTEGASPHTSARGILPSSSATRAGCLQSQGTAGSRGAWALLAKCWMRLNFSSKKQITSSKARVLRPGVERRYFRLRLGVGRFGCSATHTTGFGKISVRGVVRFCSLHTITAKEGWNEVLLLRLFVYSGMPLLISLLP